MPPRVVTSGQTSGGNTARLDPIAEAVRQWSIHEFGGLEHMEATTALMRIQQLIVKRIDGALQQHRLTFAQYEALLLLHFSREGSLPLGRMGQRLMVHPATVTTTVDLLEEKGFVRREKAARDRRQVLAVITPEGRAVAAKATESVVAIRYGLLEMTTLEAKRIAKSVRDFRMRIGDFVEPTDRRPARGDTAVDGSKYRAERRELR